MSDPADQLAFLAEAGRVLGSSLDLNATFTQVARLCVSRLGDVCLIDLVGPPSRRVATAAADARREAVVEALLQYPPRDGHPIFDASVRRDLVIIADLDDEVLRRAARDERHFSLLKALDVDSMVLAPLVTRGETVGVLSVGRKSPRRFTPADVQLVSQIADRAAVAVDNARLYALEHTARTRAEQLQRVTAALSGALAPQHVAHVILSEGLVAAGAAGGAVTLVAKEKTYLEVVGFVGYDPEVIHGPLVRIPVDLDVPIAAAYHRREPVFVENRDAWNARFSVAAIAARGHESWAALPLMVGTEAIGALGVSFQGEREFDVSQRAFLGSLAGLCAQALHRAQLYAAEREARAAAEEALKVREDFLAVASHELRTPLTPLLLQLGLLRNTLAATPLVPKIDLALRQAERLARLTGNLLDVSRIQTGALTLDLGAADLDALVRGVAERFAGEAEKALSRVELDLDNVKVTCDALRIDQVVTNLISNALKFGAGKPIHVTLRQAEDRAVLSVADQGIGIAEDALPLLFHRFARAVSQREFGGLGLGLYISRQIAEAHGGTLNVASETGRGATFTLVLPLERS